MGKTQDPARIMATWLFTVCGFIVAMVVIGAITRLTESGLSITYWKPVTGALPPLSDAAWGHEFDLYRQSPEYLQKNAGMTMDEFKFIFFWEWFHRLWGRLIGLVYAMPLVFFAVKGWVRQRDIWIYAGLLLLGGAQGFMGWFMVQSGLVDEPRVSHYRLAAHLGLAFILFALVWWQALRLDDRARELSTRLPGSFCLNRHGWISLAALSVTILWGAFTAGLDAGLVYNEWPLMGNGLVPPEIFFLTPAWLNFFDNHATVQFTHRWLAMAAFAVIVSWAWRLGTLPSLRRLSLALLIVSLAQVGLGIATLLSGVNIVLAAAHQANAVALLALVVTGLFQIGGSRTARA